MKKLIFSYFSTIFFLFLMLTACDPGTSTNEGEVADEETEILVEEADEEVAAEPVDLVLLTYMNNRLQYAMGEMALENSDHSEVRDYAQFLTEEDQDIRFKLEDLAQATNTDLPEVIGADQKMKIDSIEALPASDFNRAFLTESIQEYQENIDRLNELIDEGDNPMVEGLAAELIDLHQERIDRAAVILKEIS